MGGRQGLVEERILLHWEAGLSVRS